MPTYTYMCPTCEMEIDVQHSMSDIDNPSEEVQKETSCNEMTCKQMQSSKIVPEGKAFKRVLSVPSVLRYGHGSNGRGGLMTTAEKQKAFRKRSDQDDAKKGVNDEKISNAKKIADKYK